MKIEPFIQQICIPPREYLSFKRQQASACQPIRPVGKNHDENSSLNLEQSEYLSNQLALLQAEYRHKVMLSHFLAFILGAGVFSMIRKN